MGRATPGIARSLTLRCPLGNRGVSKTPRPDPQNSPPQLPRTPKSPGGSRGCLQIPGRRCLLTQQKVGDQVGLDFANGPWVLSQLSIRGQESDALTKGLPQQQAVERIFVKGGQGVDVHRVGTGDGKLNISVVE